MIRPLAVFPQFRPRRPPTHRRIFLSHPTTSPFNLSRGPPRLTGGPTRSFSQISRDRCTRVACPLQSSLAAWLNSSDARRSASSPATTGWILAPPSPIATEAPLLPFLQHLAARAHHHIARSRLQSLMPPVFSVTSPQSRRPGPCYATIPPPPTQTAAATAPFLPCQKLRPDNLLLRARPHDCSRLSSHPSNLASSAVPSVTSIISAARRRPPPPNLNHWQNRACAAPSLAPNG